MSSEENLNPISCELCRQRKCKRLAETESALYGALMTIRSMGQPITVQIPAKTDTTLKHKAARMEEWSHLALQDWAGMERWLTAMSDRFTIEQPSDVVPDTSGGYTIPMSPTHDESQTLGDQPHSRLVSYAWPPRDNRVTSGSSYDAPQPHPGVMPSPVYFEQAVEPEPVPSPGSSRDGMIDDEDAGVSVDVNASVRARVETGPSKAEELSHNNPSLYF
ncbi:hypothetical protein N7517_005078 [Penicillium concentricum]|uniref:Zn(2)-C6 fungal-type domain-containing protein n=1 Tax=Penicillium concentricum TaxID=293559 RepID=A0A9W9S6Q6_9EURO|nr:uncharacterized protein N7517_005078 [Penicillium concentricum]KAJ5373072.1 hypothetical protein N7517_005078 [Penicillium concentricum]